VLHEHRWVEGLCADRHPCRCLPPQIEAETIRRFAIRQPLEGLEEHHRRQDARRHRRSTVACARVAIGEVIVTEQLVAVGGQELVDRPILQSVPENSDRIIEALPFVRLAKGHAQVFQDRDQIASTNGPGKSAVT